MINYQSRALATIVFATLMINPLVASAKGSACSPDFQAQISAQYLDGGKVSSAKVDAQIAKLTQKRAEVAAIDVSKVEYEADLKGKTAKKKKIDKAVKKSKSLMALDAAIDAAKSIKTATTAAQVCEAAAAVSDLSGAVRIEGADAPIIDMWRTASAVLSKWKVPKQSPASDEASNLVDPKTGQIMSAADIAAAVSRGVDLSTLDPAPGSVFYTPLKNISQVDVKAAANGSTIPMFADLGITIPANPTFVYEGIKKSDTKPKMDATIDGIKGAKFKLKFEAEYNADPTVGAVMMTLGFPSDLSHYMEHIRLVLPKGVSIHDMTRDWESYFSRDTVTHDGKIEDNIESTSTDAQGRTVIVWKKGSIEIHPDKIGRIGGWKYSDGDHLSRREVRGMTIVQMWLDNSDLKEFENNKMLIRKNDDGSVQRMLMDSDVGHSLGFLYLETPSLYTWNMVTSTSGSTVDFGYRGMHPVSIRKEITLADTRWGARLISKLTREQIKTAVAQGGWPDCVQQIYVEKMISRRNNLVQSLGLVGTRNNDGTVVQLLPVAQDRSKYDIENICHSQPLVKDDIDTYGYNVGSFVGPILLQAKREALDLARSALGGEKRLVIDSKKFSTKSVHPVGEVIFNMNREIERNPHPKSEQDLFMVKDHFEVGLRVGVAYGPYAAVVVRANYELAYPARSQQEAGMNNGFIVNLLLPKDAREGKLPASYVLKSEYSREFEFGVNADHLASPISPVIRAAAGELKLWRSIYDHRDGKKIVLYRDKADSKLDDLQIYARLGILEIPIFSQYHDWGNAEGKGLTVSQAELDSNPSLSKAIDKAVVDADFSLLASREQSFFTQDDFERSMHKWNLLVFNTATEKRLDKIELTTDKDGKNRDVVQYRVSKDTKTNFIIASKVEKKAVIEVWADPSAPNDFELQVNVMGSDVKTTDKELADKYLHFVNGLSIDSKPLIPLTPSLGYTTNGSWGDTLTQSNTTYSIAAMNRIMSATSAQFYSALASSMGVSTSALQAMAAGGDRTHSQDGVIDHAKDFLKKLDRAKAEPTLAKKVKLLAEAFRKAIYIEKAGFYSPAILGALNRIAGEDAIYSRNLITVPEPKQIDLIEGTPMFGKIGKPMKNGLKYLIFEPTTALDLYNMFDTWF